MFKKISLHMLSDLNSTKRSYCRLGFRRNWIKFAMQNVRTVAASLLHSQLLRCDGDWSKALQRVHSRVTEVRRNVPVC